MRTLVSTAFMQFLACEAARSVGRQRVGAHIFHHLSQDALPLLRVCDRWRDEVRRADCDLHFRPFGQVARRLRDERPVAVDCFQSLRHVLTPSSTFYTVTASRYSPQTWRRRWLISPTVASDSTQESMRGSRFLAPRAASSRSVRATSTLSASRRARQLRTRSTCARSTSGSMRSVGTAASSSERKRLTPTTTASSVS